MHTYSSIIKKAEERTNKILDADYSQDDINAMVQELEKHESTKGKLYETLKKLPRLFGGDLGE